MSKECHNLPRHVVHQSYLDNHLIYLLGVDGELEGHEFVNDASKRPNIDL